MRVILISVFTSFLLSLAACSSDRIVPENSMQSKPKLVVFISIDQWHRDLLERYKEHYSGGFKTIWEDSRFYTNAFHDHAATLTGPGHSVLLTGVFPNKTGITGNHFYDRELDEELYCVADTASQVISSSGVTDKSGVSPKNLLVPTLGDLLKSQSPDSKVFSVSGKDRSAILMAGKKADGVFWYDKSLGQLVTSSFYTEELADFIKAYNKTHPIQKYNPGAWRRLRPESFYFENARQDLFPGEYLIENKNFPYQLAPRNADDTSFHSMVSRTPFADQYILDASEFIIDSQELGKDNSPDLISIGLSATDYIGHAWGPYSQEALDHMLRLDQSLGQFFDNLKYRFGDDVVIALSSDHGVLPLPEYLAQKGNEAAKRIPKQQVFDDVAAIVEKLSQELDIGQPMIELKEGSYTFFNPELTLPQKRRFVEEVEKLDYINRVVITEDLLSSSDQTSQFVAKAHYQPRSRDIYFIFQPHILVSRSLGTTHGSLYSYDQHVPIVLIGRDFKGELVEDKVSVTDIAPTLAKLLGIQFDGFDGKILP